MTKPNGDKSKELREKLEPLPPNGEAHLVNGRYIDLSVAISLKRIADKLHIIATAIQRPRR